MPFNLDEILRSMNLPKKAVTFNELELLSDEIDDKIIEIIVKDYNERRSPISENFKKE